MADDKSKTAQDRKLVALTQRYELDYFANKWGLTLDEARTIIEASGPSRKACDAAARQLHDDRAGRFGGII